MPAPKASQIKKKRKKGRQEDIESGNKDTKRRATNTKGMEATEIPVNIEKIEATETVQETSKTHPTDTAEKTEVVALAKELPEPAEEPAKETQEAKLPALPEESTQLVILATEQIKGELIVKGDSVHKDKKDDKKKTPVFIPNFDKWFKDNNMMEYLQYEAMMEGEYGYGAASFDDGLNPWREEAGAFAVDRSWHGGDTFVTGRMVQASKDYWKGNAPVLEKVDYNGESVVVPKIAPRDEKQVTVRKVILDRTISVIENHQGSSRVNWHWKTQIFANRMNATVPALLVTAKQVLPTLREITTLNLYAFTDAVLTGLNVHQELDIGDPADANAILAASRATCRFIGVTLTLNPQQIVPQGTMVDAADLSTASSIRVYFRAPQDAAGGLLNAVTKDMLVNSPEDMLRLAEVPTFLAI